MEMTTRGLIGTNSPVSSDADTILYADSEDNKGIPDHSSSVLIPWHTSSSGETIEIEIRQILGHTSSGDSDDTIEIDVVGEIPGHTVRGCTKEAAEILATLAAGGDTSAVTSADAEIPGHTNGLNLASSHL